MQARIGYLLIVVGLGLAVVGLLIVLRVKLSWLVCLPGFSQHPADIHTERDGTHFHFPIVPCLVLSIVLTALFLRNYHPRQEQIQAALFRPPRQHKALRQA